nr:hypothetical protein [Glycomyces xiaoerkulensis]
MTDTQDSPPTGEVDLARAPKREPRWAAVVLGVGALASLGGVLYSLYSLTGMADGLDQTGVMILALSLFSPVIVAMFAGAVGGVTAARLDRPRLPATALGSAAVGLLAGATAYALFSVDAAIALALALLLFGSALVGGALAMPRGRMPVVAGLGAALVLLMSMFLRGLLDSASRSLFSDPLDRYNLLGAIAPFAVGLLCGFAAFGLLRAARSGSKLYGHLFAGALPGLIWFLATIVAQIGVEVVLALGADRVAPADEASLALTFQWQYNGSMTVLFAGAVCSVLAYGLLLPKTPKSSLSSDGAYQSRTCRSTSSRSGGSEAAIASAASASSTWTAATLASLTTPSRSAAVPSRSDRRRSGTSADTTARRGTCPTRRATAASAASANAVYSRSSRPASGAAARSSAVTMCTGAAGPSSPESASVRSIARFAGT